VALPGADPTVVITNLGPDTVYIKFGTSNAVTAATSDTPLTAGMVFPFSAGANTYVAGITASGTAAVTITTGSGTPSFGLALTNAPQGVKGSIAAGSSVADPPVMGGCRASDSAPTATTDGKVVNCRADLLGNGINWPYAPRQLLVSGLTAAMTSTTSTAVTGMGAPGLGLFNYITTLVCGNSHATVGTFVELQDGSGGTTFFTVPAAAVYGGSVLTFPAPLKQPTANTALFAKDTTTGANVICAAAGFKAP